MASFFDKVKSTNANQNTIGNVVSFSGSDITVVAYRGKTPASRFAVATLKKEIEKVSIEEANDKATKAEAEIRLKSAQGDLQATQEEIANRAVELRHSGAPVFAASTSSLNNREGRYQNRVTEATGAVTIADRILEISVDKRRSLEKELSDIDSIEGYFELGSIHTISYSSFREKFAVRALGTTQAKAYTRGPRTIAGTMVFNVLQQHDFLRMVANKAIDKSTKAPPHPDAIMLDQIDPFNLLLLFANEFGAYSALHLLNVDLNSEGQEMSVDSIITHNTMNFYATDMIPMTSLGNRFKTYDEMIIGTISDITEAGFTSGSVPLRTRIDNVINPFRDGEESSLLANSRGLF